MKFQCYPEGKAYTIQELETLLQFRYLPHISFETRADRQDIRTRGIDKWKNGGISKEAFELAIRFIERVEAAYIPNVSIRWIDNRLGYGLFLEENLESGSYVGEYTGRVRKDDRRYFEPLNNYCYAYPVPDDSGRSFVIDATEGNLTRFINHSFTPNLKPKYIYYDGFYHLIFLAIQPIEKGSQLSYNYGYSYWYIRQKPVTLHID